MLFWFAVTPRSSALIAHSTAGQCSVVKRAPMPSVPRPRLALGGRKDRRAGDRAPAPRSSAGAGCPTSPGTPTAPSASATPSSSDAVRRLRRSRAAAATRSRPSRSSSTSVQVPAAVSKRLFGQHVSRMRPPSASRAERGQSRQKSGLMQGLRATRMSLSSRNRLMRRITGPSRGIRRRR